MPSLLDNINVKPFTVHSIFKSIEGIIVFPPHLTKSRSVSITWLGGM